MIGVKLLVFLLVCQADAAALRYWVEPCSKPETGCHASDPELAQWAMEAWQSASGGKLTLRPTGAPDTAQIRVHWVSGKDGLYGEAQPIVVDGIRGAEVYVLPEVVSPDVADALLRETIVYLTCLHETGHALGLAHTADFADIMYSFQYGGDITEYFARYRRQLSSRADIRKHAGMSEEDRRRLVELWTAK
jgi:Matrixin